MRKDAPDRHAADVQFFTRTRIGVDEHADGIAAGSLRRHTRRSPNAGLERECAHSGAGADVATWERPRARRIECSHCVGRRNVPPDDVVDALIVTFGHDGQRHVGIDPDIGMPRDEPRDDAVIDARHVERIGQRDRHFQKSRLVDPVRTRHLAVSVEVIRRGCDALGPRIVVGQHDRHAGSDRADPRHERSRRALDLRHLADAHARDVRDRIERPRLHRPDDDTRRSSRTRRWHGKRGGRYEHGNPSVHLTC